MLRYQRLAKLVKDCALALWPGYSDEIKALDATFVPLLRLELGDYGSDFAIQLGRIIGENPDQLAGMLCGAMPEPLMGAVSHDRGYFNIRLVDGLLEYVDYPVDTELFSNEFAVAVQPYTQALRGMPYLRLLSSALLQSRLLEKSGAKVSLSVAGQRHKGPFTAQLTQQLFERFVEGVHSTSSVRDDFLEFTGASHTGTYWLYPPALPNKDFALICESRPPPMILKGSLKEWLMGYEDSNLQSLVSGVSQDDYDSLVLYLAGSTLASELDLFVPGSDEKANIIWYLATSRERFSKLFEGFSWPALNASPALGDRLGIRNMLGLGNAQLEADWRQIWIRAVQLNDFYLRAATQAETLPLLSALYDFLDCVNHKFNTPAFRLRLATQAVSRLEGQILAGVRSTVSDTIFR